MPEAVALTGLARDAAEQAGVPSYVHTVNSPVAAGCFADLGIAGVYTDSLGGTFPPDRLAEACRDLSPDQLLPVL